MKQSGDPASALGTGTQTSETLMALSECLYRIASVALGETSAAEELTLSVITQFGAKNEQSVENLEGGRLEAIQLLVEELSRTGIKSKEVLFTYPSNSFLRAIQQLDLRQRVLLALIDIEGLTFEQAAKMLRLEKSVARRKVYAARLQTSRLLRRSVPSLLDQTEDDETSDLHALIC